VKKLTYYIDHGNGEYEPYYEYSIPVVGIDEMYARQLCTYFIIGDRQYELISNEMMGEEDILVIKEIGQNPKGSEEKEFHRKGLYIEIRSYREEENFHLLSLMPFISHFDIIRYLLKDIVDVPGYGQREVTSTEIDEDRGVYVLYVKDLGEELI